MDTQQTFVEMQPFAEDTDNITKQKIAKHKRHTATTVEENTRRMAQAALREPDL
jgi:hypothetical protein